MNNYKQRRLRCRPVDFTVIFYLVADYQTRTSAFGVLRRRYQRAPAARRSRIQSQRAFPAVGRRLFANHFDRRHFRCFDFRHSAVLQIITIRLSDKSVECLFDYDELNSNGYDFRIGIWTCIMKSTGNKVFFWDANTVHVPERWASDQHISYLTNMIRYNVIILSWRPFLKVLEQLKLSTDFWRMTFSQDWCSRTIHLYFIVCKCAYRLTLPVGAFSSEESNLMLGSCIELSSSDIIE